MTTRAAIDKPTIADMMIVFKLDSCLRVPWAARQPPIASWIEHSRRNPGAIVALPQRDKSALLLPRVYDGPDGLSAHETPAVRTKRRLSLGRGGCSRHCGCGLPTGQRWLVENSSLACKVILSSEDKAVSRFAV